MNRQNNNSKSRTRLTIKRKKEIIQYAEENRSLKQRDLAEIFKISLGTVNQIFQKADIIKNVKDENSKSQSKLKVTHKFDKALFQWFLFKRSQKFPISEMNLKTMAKNLANKFKIENFSASNGWLDSFKRRYNLSAKSLSGESDFVRQEVIEQFQNVFDEKLSHYDNKDIFNADETGLFFRATNKKTLVTANDNLHGYKIQKERITLLLCVSMLGEKLELMAISKSKNPRCFRKQQNILNKLKIVHKSSKNAWMTSQIFYDWLQNLNHKMKCSNRKILLILDNAPVHPTDLELSHIEFLFLPKNCTSKIQALDQGVIKAFKDKYRTHLSEFILSQNDDIGESCDFLTSLRRLDLFQVYLILHQSWLELSENIIINCWRKSFENMGKMTEDTKEITKDHDIENDQIHEIVNVDDNQFFEDFFNQSNEDMCNLDAREDTANIQESSEPIISKPTYQEILEFLPKLELWFLENGNENIVKFYNLRQEIYNMKSGLKMNIEDYFIRKK